MISTRTQKIPRLRFREFSGDWKEKKLGDVTKINQGLQIAISERHTHKVPGSHFYITNEFLKEGAKKQYYIFNPPKSVIAAKDDLLMTRTGNTGIVVTGVSGAFHNNFFKVKRDEQKVAKGFLYYFLTSKPINNLILRLAGTSTIPDLNHSDFYIIPINLPKLTEQTKIAGFLGVADDKISGLQKKKELLQKYKKGIMKKIFFQKARFKSEIGKDYPTWQTKKLGDLLSTTSKMPVSDTSKYQKMTVKLHKQGLEFTESGRKMADTRPFYVRVENEIIIGKQNYFNGSIAIVDKEHSGCICSNAIMSFAVNGSNNIKFIYEYISSRDFLKRREALANGTGQKELSEKDFLNFEFTIPKDEEQHKIAEFLTSLDDKIELTERELEHANKFKKALLQQMFV